MSRFDVDWDEMEDLRVVAPFLDELRTEFAEGPAPHIGTELATLFVFGAPPIAVVTPPKTQSRARVVRRVAAGAVGGLALVGGMGAAGALPGPIQEPVANAARYMGINLPRPHHHHRAEAPATDSQKNGDVTHTSTPRTHHQTHVSTTGPDDPTLLAPDGSSTGTAGTGASTSRTSIRSGSSSSTGNSTVTGSGSAVSSTSSDTHNGTNQGGKRPTYHGNGRTTRDRETSTSTTTPPADGSGSGSGDGSTTPSTSPPTTAAP